MALLELMIFTLTLLFEGGSSGESINVFHHCEQDATLPCKGPLSYGPQGCSSVSWLYNRDSDITFWEVRQENVIAQSGRGDRLRLNPDCSLVVRNITTEDVGRYTCRQNENTYYDVIVHLNILTVRLDPAVSDQRRDGEVQLKCTLFRYKGITQCRNNGLRWLDESWIELKEGVQKYFRRGDCLSRLTVKLQNGSSRRFSCQYVNRNNKVEIEAGYTPGFKDPGPALTPVPAPDPVSDSGPVPEHGPDLTFVIVGVLLGVLLLLVVSSVVLLKHRRGGAKVTEGQH